MLQALLNLLTGQKKTPKRQVGDWAEELAAKELLKKRYKILKRNWTASRDEIDIIAEEAGQIVFVEVRARSCDAMVPGYFTVDKRKKTALRRAVNTYIREHGECAWRFDIIDVSYKNPHSYEIYHYEGIPL